MIEIDEKLVSTELFDINFLCDLGKCKGICCVEGNSGAPLEENEVSILESEYEAYAPYMKEEGRMSVEHHGFMVIDEDGDLTTPLINGAECAYVCEEKGVTFCAVERAYLAGKTEFRKPVSCHLYPVRVSEFSNGSFGLNFHRWSICSDAIKNGKKLGLPVFRMLKDPLIRKFGHEFYVKMEEFYKIYTEENF
ncbi:MAG: DUF3109 family protein [Rikenellaceae bacterium]|nr:DUF3109 family protein [Rikenellaceae bacterium]